MSNIAYYDRKASLKTVSNGESLYPLKTFDNPLSKIMFDTWPIPKSFSYANSLTNILTCISSFEKIY